MKIVIDIRTENAAFGDDNREDEIFQILENVSQKISVGHTDGNFRDSNGNTVGKFKVTGK